MTVIRKSLCIFTRRLAYYCRGCDGRGALIAHASVDEEECYAGDDECDQDLVALVSMKRDRNRWSDVPRI
jgi:hypothetical protein